jgi:hypothetical protein
MVHLRVVGNNGDPLTRWGRAKYYIKPGAKPDGDKGRLTSIPIRQTYGAFQPQDNRLIFANIVTPVRKFLVAGKGFTG